MLNCLHETHSGMNKMKAVARSHFWWPNLDTQIEFLVNKCRSCQQSQDGPNKGKWQPWKWSTRPWQRIHIDFANKETINLLIVVDSHSKWIEAIPMRETTTRKTIEQLRRLFSSYGLPEELVSYNGPQFTGCEMKSFLEGIGIKQTLIPAYHPQSNGLAERAVRTIKTALDKNKRKIGDTIQDTLSKVLLAYRSIPHVTTGKTPSELVSSAPGLTKYKSTVLVVSNDIDYLVWCKNFRGGDKWIPGKIVGKKETRVYIILIHGQVKAYHRDQIRKRWRNGEEDESGDGERQPEHSRGAGLTSQRSDQDSEVQSDTDDGKSLEPLRSLDPEAMREECPVQRRKETSSMFAGRMESAQGDAELENFFMMQKNVQEFKNQVSSMTDICWEKCMDKPGSRLDPKLEYCLSNCVDRFIDASKAITVRFSEQLTNTHYCSVKILIDRNGWFDKQKQGYQKKWTPDYRNHKYSREHSNNLVDTMKSGINEQVFETYVKEFEDSPYERNDRQIWCIDSGCTAHLTPNLTLMENVTEYKSEINLAEKGKTTQAIAKGDMRLTTCTSEGQENIRIKDILHVPNLRNNFLFEGLFKRSGIDHQLITTYSPQSNGVAESVNRTLIDTARTLLIDSKLPMKFWAEAIATAAYIKNCTPQMSIKHHTPIQRWNGRKPSIKHIRIFGCLTHWLESKPRRNKFSPKGRKGIFIGYSIKRKSYRIYDIMTKRIHEVRSVKFSEDKRGIDYANDIQEDTNCDNLTYKGNYEEIVAENFLILKKDNPVTESKMKSQEDTSIKPGGDTENDLSQTEPIEEICVKGGRKKGETKSILEERHKARLEEQESKLIKEGVRRPQRIKDRNDANLIMEK
ncbi:K02A2.6-like [Cordylochernes scorpioides]|uniref:RNA-directed DNA polymerase n=1 Tax=Cordylochernes scorpioides TaxID=51811 RepID=A0ABY6L8T0_9ARAC|nr:K02A2.6-like [Cordylochernes scorpioides]